MNIDNKINYVEFPASNFEATKAFFGSVFGWEFEDFGPDYTAFSNAGVDGGFFRSGQVSTTKSGAALVILYSKNLEVTQEKVAGCGGTILQPIYAFPGGRRFHFLEPSGNELAVWSDAAV